LQFWLQAASPETFGYNLVNAFMNISGMESEHSWSQVRNVAV